MRFSFHLADEISCVATPMMVRVGSDDRTAVAACEGKLLRVDLDERKQVELGALPNPPNDLAVCTDHRLIAVAAGAADVAIYNLDTGAQMRAMSREGAPGSLKNASANHIAIGPDGKMLVTTTAGSRIFISDIETGQWEHIMFVKYDGCDVAVSPDGRYVALFGAPKRSEISGHLTMFLVRRGLQPLWTRWHESTNAITSCRFSPDSKSLTTCGAGDGARVWGTVTGELQWHHKTENSTGLQAAWSFGAEDTLATVGDDLSIVKRSESVPMFRNELRSPDSKFANSQSGKLMIRVDGADLTVWKLSDSH